MKISFVDQADYDDNDFDLEICLAHGVKVIEPESNHEVVVYFPNGNCIAIYSDGKVEIWDQEGGNLKKTLSLG